MKKMPRMTLDAAKIVLIVRRQLTYVVARCFSPLSWLRRACPGAFIIHTHAPPINSRYLVTLITILIKTLNVENITGNYRGNNVFAKVNL